MKLEIKNWNLGFGLRNLLNTVLIALCLCAAMAKKIKPKTMKIKLITAFCIAVVLTAIAPQQIFAETAAHVCNVFGNPGAEVGDECEDDSGFNASCFSSSTGGGGDGGGIATLASFRRAGCGTCGAPKVSLHDMKVYIEDTPFFYKIPAGPDIFLKWRYINYNYNYNNKSSILGRNIECSNFDICISNEHFIRDSSIILTLGSDSLKLFYDSSENTYTDFFGICEAKVQKYNEITVFYPRHKVKQVFGPIFRGVCYLKYIISDNGKTNVFNRFLNHPDYISRLLGSKLHTIVELGGACRTAEFLYSTSYYTHLTNCVLRAKDGTILRSASFAYDNK